MLESTVNQYKIINQLGEGGMGVVYLAEDTRLHRKAALKFITGSLQNTSEVTRRFQREAQAAAGLNHPNICTVYELGEHENQAFIALEYIEGETLKERMRRGNISDEEIRDWLGQIASGLLAAHEQGVVHRDIKPANIMITSRGHIKIMDFGIAKLTEVETELTQANSTIGTISYMSPEQARGEQVDHRTDIWSLGVIMYELTTGQKPFSGAFREAVMYAMMHEEVKAPSTINAEIHEDIDRVINKCLERDCEKRYGSLEELLADLEGKEVDRVKASGVLQVAHVSGDATTLQPHVKKEKELTLLGSKKRRWIASGIVVMLGVMALFPGLRRQLTGQGEGAGLPTAMHLAVLPFDTFGDDPEQKAFSNGMAHLVATNLMRMDHDKDEMWVIPVREVLSREVKSASEAKEAFGVNLAVSGTIVNVGDGVQISLDVTDVRTLRAIASDVVELDVLDPRNVQEHIMRKLAVMLQLELPKGSQLAIGDQTADPEAYKLYIQAEGFIQRYNDEGNIDEAIRLYEEAIGIDSTYALAYARAGFAYARKYHFTRDIALFDQANEYVDKALELNDELAEVWTALGRVRLDSGENEEALAALEKAVSIDSSSFEIYRRLALVYLRAQDFERAEAYYKQAIALQPNYWEVHNSMGLFLGNRGRLEESIASFTTAAELDPENALIFTNLATQYYNIGDTLKCIEMLEHSIDLNPNALSYNNLGITLRIAHEYDRALEAFKKAVGFSGNTVDYNVNLGNTFYVLQQPDSARVYWLRAATLVTEQLEKVNPNDPTLLPFAAEVFAKLGDKESAQLYLQRYLDLQGEHTHYWNTIYLIYEYLDDRPNALAALERALELGFEPWYQDWSPWLVDVYDDPDYIALLEKYGKTIR